MDCKPTQRLLQHPYVPGQIRSRPFQWIQFPVWCCASFLAYWLVVCPLVYIALFRHYLSRRPCCWPHNWPLIFWVSALGLYLALLLLAVLVWRRARRQHRHKETALYQVTVREDRENREDCEKPAVLAEPEALPSKDFARCSVRAKPRPLSINCAHESPAVAGDSPMTPREAFFIDLIQAANQSPASQVPVTQLFLDNERGCYSDGKPLDDRSAAQSEPSETQVEDLEYFIANVPVTAAATTEAFLYVDGDVMPCLAVTVCDNGGN